MNKDILQGNWKQIRGEVKRQWGMLTDDELDQVDGMKDKLVGKIQEKYGYDRMRAEQEVEHFLSNVDADLYK